MHASRWVRRRCRITIRTFSFTTDRCLGLRHIRAPVHPLYQKTPDLLPNPAGSSVSGMGKDNAPWAAQPCPAFSRGSGRRRISATGGRDIPNQPGLAPSSALVREWPVMARSRSRSRTGPGPAGVGAQQRMAVLPPESHAPTPGPLETSHGPMAGGAGA